MYTYYTQQFSIYMQSQVNACMSSQNVPQLITQHVGIS